MIFAIEGLATCTLSVITFFLMTDRPETAIWLSPEEKLLALARVKSERVATTAVLDKLDTQKVLRGILNPVTIATGLIFLFDSITVQGVSIFAPMIVKAIYPQDSVISLQIRTVPFYLVEAFTVILCSSFSWKYDRRNIFFIICSPFTTVGYIMFLSSTNPNIRYAALFLISAGAYPHGSLCSAQVAANVVSDTARSAAIGAYITIGTFGGVISTWSFLPSNGPNYPIGNGINLATSASMTLVAVALSIWMKKNNSMRDHQIDNAELAGLTHEQIEDLDWHHPEFRWKP